ncbi:hypothetical protein C8J57DRAFT_1521287 [Mycena rebaudengoi]|nr:hypothetical protein C8J57DRAFT_1521287 [Mycena rebaudengoi]
MLIVSPLDETGWSWVIPLRDGTTSIGFVMHQNASNAKKATVTAEGQKPTLTEYYLDRLQFVPGVRELIGEKGNMIPASTKSAADYSYWAPRYSGDHFRIIGDAAKMMTICKNYFDPYVDDENVKAAPVIGLDNVRRLLKDDTEAESDVEPTYKGGFPLLGYIANMKKGELGLNKTTEGDQEL